MRIVVIAAILLSCPIMALADGGGPVKPPTVGAVTPASSGTELGVPPKPAPGNDDTTAVPVGTDTSSAAPGGTAESTRNGALSGPNTAKDAARRDHPKPADAENEKKP